MMKPNEIIIRRDKYFEDQAVIALYEANQWSAAKKPEALIQGLKRSHTLITAYLVDRLVGLGNAISDGYLVVYFPHLLVHPDYQGLGIGKKIMFEMNNIYGGFHQQMLTADRDAVEFYQKCGFTKAGDTEAMWIYSGTEH